jgi:hypothetical protein
MTELIRQGKDTISLQGCSVVKPHYYKTNNKQGVLYKNEWLNEKLHL